MASSIIKTIFRKAEGITKASHPYLYDGIVAIRNGNVVSVIINGLKDIPTGVVTTICTLPVDYRPLSTDRSFDLSAPSTTGNPASLRVSIRTSGNVDVYLYYDGGSSIYINNVKATLTFAI